MSQVRASHLLVKHQGSRRPASWKDESGAVITKRTKEQVRSHSPNSLCHSNAIGAVHKLYFDLSSSPSSPQAIATLLGFHAQIVAGADFAALVRILPQYFSRLSIISLRCVLICPYLHSYILLGFHVRSVGAQGERLRLGSEWRRPRHVWSRNDAEAV
jgi:hypothetical protein